MGETFKSILERMKNGLRDGASAIEGTFTGNNLLVVADELARIYSQDIDMMLARAFAKTAEGDDLERVGDDIAISRKAATCAEAELTVTGSPGRYPGLLVSADGILFLTDGFVIGNSGTADVRAICQTPGPAGNVPAGTIKDIKTSGVTLTAVINTEAACGGYEQESEEDYRRRILEKKRNIITGGNKENYRQWALSVPGVRKAKVIDLFRGPGTVGVYIIADGNKTPDTGLIEKVSAYIETVRPCGADVTVLSAEPLQIDIVATVVLSEGIGLENVRNVFMELLSHYMDSFPYIYQKKMIFSYIKVADLLIQIEGVEDVANITINGESHSITLQELQFPTLGVVTFSEQG